MPAECELKISRSASDTLQIDFNGKWTTGSNLPSVDAVKEQLLSDPAVSRIICKSDKLTQWNSGLLIFISKLLMFCSDKKIDMGLDEFPPGVRRLIALSYAVPEKKQTEKKVVSETLLKQIGGRVINIGQSLTDGIGFLGDVTLAFLALLRGRAGFRRVDLMSHIQESGPRALGIATLISGLVGLILAFVGAVQLEMFGAEIFVADLVGIGMTREMGAMMTGIIMAGRTGAAYAAQLGTMQVNEEIDALRTFGFSPVEFLIMPRLLALSLMMPLLCIYADIVGMLGGLFVGVTMLDIPMVQYLNQTVNAVGLDDLIIGILKSVVFGILVAFFGCLRGIQCGRSASAVGLATTSAVVTAIVAIVVSDGLFAVLTHILNI